MVWGDGSCPRPFIRLLCIICDVWFYSVFIVACKFIMQFLININKLQSSATIKMCSLSPFLGDFMCFGRFRAKWKTTVFQLLDPQDPGDVAINFERSGILVYTLIHHLCKFKVFRRPGTTKKNVHHFQVKKTKFLVLSKATLKLRVFVIHD